ncbi:MAG: hypothetical protein MUC50_17315 [Myxococcota bacterium]|jgi:hypothetical protein|nr:hypothetical protein [Myxococcota bacterium]
MNTRFFANGACALVMLASLSVQGCAPQNSGDEAQGTETDTATATVTSTDTEPNDSETGSFTHSDTDTGPGSSLVLPARGAFYYPWYPQTWSVEGSHVFYHPTLGYYSSDDVEVVDQHIEDMEYAKIDVAIASWWGMEDQHQDTRIPLLLDRTVAKGSKLKWTFYYEREGFGDPSVDELKANLDYLMTTYVDHEAIARVSGKPVIFVYGGDCETASRWSEASQGKWYVSLKVASGFKDCPVQPDTWHQYGPDSPAQQHAGYSYVIAPGFWRADQDKALLSRDLDRWYQNVADMVASLEPWQLITTFNEWGEGTAVEPASEWASDSGYGQYLDALHTDGVK